MPPRAGRKPAWSHPTSTLVVTDRGIVVDEFLESTYRPGMTAEKLWEMYTTFGDDAFVVAPGGAVCKFSGWEYARERCRVLCGPAISSP